MEKHSIPALIDSSILQEARHLGPASISLLRQHLKTTNQQLVDYFKQNIDLEILLSLNADCIDSVLKVAWDVNGLSKNTDICLVAVGGYGRRELHPRSDIDILILAEPAILKKTQTNIEHFIGFLWDVGLNPAHSVRSTQECLEEAEKDISVLTALLESRLLMGEAQYFETMGSKIQTCTFWQGDNFFQAKMQEQTERHEQYQNTSYALEPNVKNSPGGLRDIQMIKWLAKRYFNTLTLEDLIEDNFLTRAEYEEVLKSVNFLWELRFFLHLMTKRGENRLLFSYQKSLSKQMAYLDDGKGIAIEHFMQDYYRSVKSVSEINKMLIQFFKEAIIEETIEKDIQEIDEKFQLCNHYIETYNNLVFDQHPGAILELFLHLAKNPQIKGVRAETIRQIKSHKYLIDKDFRKNKTNQQHFIKLIKKSNNISQIFSKMNQYGILGRYIPEFGDSIGKMQFDLFHAYTVDQHTLFLLKNLEDLLTKPVSVNYSIPEDVIAKIHSPELLYIAALYHDIAKGRGGDNSELGSVDAMSFCQSHSLSETDAQLVSWLVKEHLLMSQTAQKKDITDPNVINTFISKLPKPFYLDYFIFTHDCRYFFNQQNLIE